MTTRTTWRAALAILMLLAGCADRTDRQRAAADAQCAPLQFPALTNPGNITRTHDTGMLTQLRRRC